MTDIRRLLEACACDRQGCACQRALREGKGLVHCPAHLDAGPSLNVSVRDERVLVKCHALGVARMPSSRA